MTVVGTLEAELKADPRQWEAAMGKAIEAMDRLSRRVDAASSSAAASLQKLQGSAKDLGERLSKVGAVTSGMGAAFGAAVPQMQGAVAAASGLAQSFAAGGPLLAGIALAGTVLGVVVSKLSQMKKEAADAEAALRKVAEQARTSAAAAANDLVQQERQIAMLEAQILAAPGEREAAAAEKAKEFATQDLAKKRGELARVRAEMNVLMADARTMGTLEAAQAGYSGDDIVKGVKILNEEQQKQLDAMKDTERSLQTQIDKDQKRIENMRYLVELQATLNKLQGQNPAPKAGPATTQPEDEKLAPVRTLLEQSIDAGDLQAVAVLRGKEAQELERQAMGSYALLRVLLDLRVATQDSTEAAAQASGAFGTLGNVMRDAKRSADKLARREQEERELNTARTVAAGITAAGSGRLGSFAADLGGRAIGTAVAGPGGAEIGAALGGIVGPMLDKLLSPILDPIFSALERALSGLTPLFNLLGGILNATVLPVLDILGPITLYLTEALSALLAPVMRLMQVFMPLITIIVVSLLPAIELVTDFLVQMATWIDQYVFLPLARGAAWLYNTIIDVINGIIRGINGFLASVGLERVRMHELSRMDNPESLFAMGVTGQELTSAVEDNTEAVKEFTRSMTNLPSGFRYALAEYRAEEPNGRGTPIGPRSMASRDGMVINGDVYVTAQNASVLEAIRRNMRQRGVPYGGPAASTPSERN